MSSIQVLEGRMIPSSLRMLPRPPRRLFVRGVLPPSTIPAVAVVGSRTPSPSGERAAYAIGRDLARAGIVVVSGLARGIDAAAHRGAVDAGGVSVAFLGAGPDQVTPRSSRELGEEMARVGAVAAEYEPGTPPAPYRFVERNRLIAGYARGTVVVEAGPRSGALITAGLSLEYARELWAVPGDPARPTCIGSNRLLRDGVGVALDAGDVLAGLGLRAAAASDPDREPPPGLEAAEDRLWRTLAARGVADPETLGRRTGLPVAALLEALALLELAGHVRRDPDGYRLAGDS